MSNQLAERSSLSPEGCSGQCPPHRPRDCRADPVEENQAFQVRSYLPRPGVAERQVSRTQNPCEPMGAKVEDFCARRVAHGARQFAYRRGRTGGGATSSTTRQSNVRPVKEAAPCSHKQRLKPINHNIDRLTQKQSQNNIVNR